MHDSKRKEKFDNVKCVEYEHHMTYTLQTDRRIMSFIDSRWGIEVTGGTDQYEPLTIINITSNGMARRVGMLVGDGITQIDNTPTFNLTFNEALELFRKNRRYVRIYVRGEMDDDNTCHFLFKPRKPWRRDFNPVQWNFPWNDRPKPILRESNCFMVPSKMEEKIRNHQAANSAVHK